MTSKYVYDTYAIIEIIKGNNNYKAYLDSDIIINNFIFAELCYILYREENIKTEQYLTEWKKYLVSVNPDSIKKAMQFRVQNKRKNLSTTDCISYFLAQEWGISFLTGDKEFAKLQNVEFVK